jgi:hypothetical protein
MQKRTNPGRKVAWVTKFCKKELKLLHNYYSTFLMLQKSTCNEHKVLGNCMLEAHSFLKTVLQNI